MQHILGIRKECTGVGMDGETYHIQVKLAGAAYTKGKEQHRGTRSSSLYFRILEPLGGRRCAYTGSSTLKWIALLCCKWWMQNLLHICKWCLNHHEQHRSY